MSQHAFGTAIDIGAANNPLLSRGAKVVTDLPPNVAELAAKNGLEWGGNWRRPDAMHFEWLGLRDRQLPQPVPGAMPSTIVAGRAGATGGVLANVVQTSRVAPTLGDYLANAQASQFAPPTAGNAVANFMQVRAA
nr:M15 family metallopeptidase [Shinella daejeonensis]